MVIGGAITITFGILKLCKKSDSLESPPFLRNYSWNIYISANLLILLLVNMHQKMGKTRK